MNQDTKNCKNCNTEIPKAASVCTYCGANNRVPIHKKWWFWTIVGVVLLVIVTSGQQNKTTTPTSGSASTQQTPTAVSSTPTPTRTPTPTPKPTPTPVPKITQEDYKAMCKVFAYKDIARNPGDYKSSKATFTGEVVQVLESGLDVALRVDVTKDKYGYYSDTIYVNYTKKSKDESRILEDDIITIWGELDGIKTYTSTMGGEISIPQINMEYFEIAD